MNAGTAKYTEEEQEGIETNAYPTESEPRPVTDTALNNAAPQASGGVQSLERALDILEVLGRSEGDLGVSEVGVAVAHRFRQAPIS